MIVRSCIFVDAVLTSFLVILFVVPLYGVYRQDLGTLNDDQLRQRMKLKRLLIWCVVLTFLNQVTSIFFLIPALHQSTAVSILFLIGKLDPPINVWTSWLMIARNRQYLQRVCCCLCVRQSSRWMGRVPAMLITDSSSRKGNANIEMVDIESRVMVEMTDLSTSSRQFIALSISSA